MVVRGGNRNIIKGNTIVEAETFGIFLDPNGDNLANGDNQILDNTVISSGFSGIGVQGGKRIVIQGNTIDQCTGIGIQLFRLSSFPTEGVIIKDNSITNSNVGITIRPITFDTVVIGNTLAGNGNNDMIVDNGIDTVFADNVPNQM